MAHQIVPQILEDRGPAGKIWFSNMAWQVRRGADVPPTDSPSASVTVSAAPL